MLFNRLIAFVIQAEDQTKIIEERLVLITNSRVGLKFYRIILEFTHSLKCMDIVKLFLL